MFDKLQLHAGRSSSEGIGAVEPTNAAVAIVLFGKLDRLRASNKRVASERGGPVTLVSLV
jgi:hypothetical protein